MRYLKYIFWSVWWGLGAMLSLSPSDAQSNLSAWLNLFGFKDFPDWIKAESFDTATLIILIISGFIFYFTPKIQNKITKNEADTTINPRPKKVEKRFKGNSLISAADKGQITFDYSTHNGVVKIGHGDKGFSIGFSKASNDSIYLYNSSHKNGVNCVKIARVKEASQGDIIRFHEYDSTSSSYAINVGETFLAENADGYFLQAKILSLKDDSRGDDRDEIIFNYEINDNKSAEFKAL